MPRGQLSVEYILLALIAFSLIAVSLAALRGLSKASHFAANRGLFLRETKFFKSLSEEVCYAGDGNIREVDFPLPFSISYEEGKVHLSSPYGEVVYPLNCEVIGEEAKGKTRIENRGGVIYVS